jgi:hypothetical protein
MLISAINLSFRSLSKQNIGFRVCCIKLNERILGIYDGVIPYIINMLY